MKVYILLTIVCLSSSAPIEEEEIKEEPASLYHRPNVASGRNKKYGGGGAVVGTGLYPLAPAGVYNPALSFGYPAHHGLNLGYNPLGYNPLGYNPGYVVNSAPVSATKYKVVKDEDGLSDGYGSKVITVVNPNPNPLGYLNNGPFLGSTGFFGNYLGTGYHAPPLLAAGRPGYYPAVGNAGGYKRSG